jgi:hypothetical protein
MKPKAKALELIKQSTKLGNQYCAKRHCIFFIDEILKDFSKISDKVEFEYWKEVKKELENM